MSHDVLQFGPNPLERFSIKFLAEMARLSIINFTPYVTRGDEIAKNSCQSTSK